MNFRSALLAATVLALPLAANAQPISGLYVGAGAGINIMSSENVTQFNNQSLPGNNLSLRPGFVGVGTIGYGLGNGLRIEVEGDYRQNPFTSANNGNNQQIGVSAGGKEKKYGPMVNVAYDFTTLSPYVVPYIGAGVGYQWVNIQNGRFYGSAPGVAGFPSGEPFTTNFGGNNHGGFAYQGIAGVAFPIAGVPGLSLTAEYRFMGISSTRTYSAVTVTPRGTTEGNVKLRDNYNNGILVGLRYAFGVAPPPAPVAAVAPAPAPARSYLVFFDWDKATLTDRARQIIREAADNSTKVQYTKIEVNGYTDTSGTPKYNMGLSIRRANAVAGELVKDGVPRGAIAIQGFGETHLLVPTGPGVREPQNRRVEIIIR